MTYNQNTGTLITGSASSLTIKGLGTTISTNGLINSYNYTDFGYTNELVEYIDFAFECMGLDITYKNFKEMSKEEKKSKLRDIKIKKILC